MLQPPRHRARAWHRTAAHRARRTISGPLAIRPPCRPSPSQARPALPTCCINWPMRRWRVPVPSPCARIRTWTPPCTSRRRRPRRPHRRRLGKPRFRPWRSAILKTQTSMFVQVFCSPRNGRGSYRKVSVIIHAASWERRPVGAPTGCRFRQTLDWHPCARAEAARKSANGITNPVRPGEFDRELIAGVRRRYPVPSTVGAGHGVGPREYGSMSWGCRP